MTDSQRFRITIDMDWHYICGTPSGHFSEGWGNNNVFMNITFEFTVNDLCLCPPVLPITSFSHYFQECALRAWKQRVRGESRFETIMTRSPWNVSLRSPKPSLHPQQVQGSDSEYTKHKRNWRPNHKPTAHYCILCINKTFLMGCVASLSELHFLQSCAQCPNTFL